MITAQETKPARVATQDVAERDVSARKFASLITAGAAVLALVLATAMPAKADSKDDLAKALIAALVVGIVVNELDDKSKDHPYAKPAKHKRVPKVCEIFIDGSHRSVSMFSENCMRREGFTYGLPRRCANDARIFGRHDTVYSAECLRKAGFRISGR